jgi:hypothetical protein
MLHSSVSGFPPFFLSINPTTTQKVAGRKFIFFLLVGVKLVPEGGTNTTVLFSSEGARIKVPLRRTTASSITTVAASSSTSTTTKQKAR